MNTTMTTHPTTTDPDDRLEVISAFVDGERVDPDALGTALALAEGRAYLVDLLRLREAVADAEPPPASALLPGRPWRGAIRPMAAATVALIALAGGYVAGQRGRVQAGQEPGVRTPEILVQSSAPAPPKPTRVIKLEPGVNWIDGTGGH